MATSVMLSSASASAFACAMCHCFGLLPMPSPGDVDQALVASPSQDTKSATLSDVRDASSRLGSAPSSPDGDRIDVTTNVVPTSGTEQMKAAFVRLYQLVTALVAQVTIVVSDLISLKDRVTAVEGTQTTALVRGQETEALARQVNELCERVASQENRIATLERSQHAEADSYKKMIRELTTKLDNIRADDDKKTRDDAFERLRQSFKNLQQSMECQGARITGVKADTARKIALLQSELGGVRIELAAVKTVALPTNAPSTGQTAKDAQKARILASVAQRTENAKIIEEIELSQDPPAASAPSDCSSIKRPDYNKFEGMTVKNREITKEPLTIARANIAQPGASKIPAIPMIPIPTVPMKRLMPANGSGKENKQHNSSITTLRYTKTFQPGAGRSPDVSGKSPTASPKGSQPGAGLPSKISALQKPRKSMLPTPQKPQLPNLAKHAVAADGSSPSEVKTAYRPPGGSATRTEQSKTVECAPIAKFRASLESARFTLVEQRRPAVLPASSSLAALDAALLAMQPDNDDLLAPMPALDCLDDDLSFSVTAPIVMKARRNRDDKYESIYVPSKRRTVDVKRSKSPLKSTLAPRAENEVSLLASSSRMAPDVATKMLLGKGDSLTLLPEPDYPSVDLGFPTVIPIFQVARPHCKRESIYVSPIRTSTTKPSRRL